MKEKGTTTLTQPICNPLFSYEHLIKKVMADYKGRKVSINKPFRTPGGPKKSAVYVKVGDKTKIVRFGDPNMTIKKNIPARKKSFDARMKCATAKDKTTPRYWSCKAW